MTGKYLAAISMAALMASVAPASAATYTLSVGGGDGALSVDVDEFGDLSSGLYDALSPNIGMSETIYESYVALNSGPGYLPMSEFAAAGVTATVIDSTPTSLVSEFTINQLSFQLTQQVFQNFDVDTGELLGATLQQQFSIRNNAEVANAFQLVRYLDGDLQFDESISDGGGVDFQNGNRVLFEIDSIPVAAGDNPDIIVPDIDEQDIQTTFVGINAVGGGINPNDSYQISSYSGLDSDIRNGVPLTNTIQNDDNGDGFIDTPYDVTLALKNGFNLAANGTATYTTQTVFGNSTPPVPGRSEFNPLLPDAIEGAAFVFVIPAEAIVEHQTIFIDPEIAIGYTYTVEGGADFYSVTAPSFAAVADADGFTLIVDGMEFHIASGEQIIFADLGLTGPVYEFMLTGIDEALMLDPENTLAFITGVALQNIPSGATTIIQAPITTDTGANVVPLPATAWLMIAALGGLGGLRLRRRAA